MRSIRKNLRSLFPIKMQQLMLYLVVTKPLTKPLELWTMKVLMLVHTTITSMNNKSRSLQTKEKPPLLVKDLETSMI